MDDDYITVRPRGDRIEALDMAVAAAEGSKDSRWFKRRRRKKQEAVQRAEGAKPDSAPMTTGRRMGKRNPA